MAYVGEWERLSDAVVRVMEVTGLPKEEAQTDICRAVADGAVKIRAKLRSEREQRVQVANVHGHTVRGTSDARVSGRAP